MHGLNVILVCGCDQSAQLVFCGSGLTASQTLRRVSSSSMSCKERSSRVNLSRFIKSSVCLSKCEVKLRSGLLGLTVDVSGPDQ